MKKSAIILFFAAFISVTALAQTVQDGMNNFYAERYQSAKSVFDKMLATNPNNLEATYWLGQTYIAMGDVNSARSLYQKTLAANGNSPLIMVGMGHVDLLDKKSADARQLFEAAITASHTKKGNDPNILNAIGRANVTAYTESKPLGDLDYAIAKLTEAGQLAPTNPEIFLNLGNAYRKKHNGTEAARAYHQAGNFAPALFRAAMLYKTQNNWDIVIENLQATIAADPKFAPAYLEMYDYYLNTKRDFATAQDYANKYTANADPSPDNDYLVAQTYYVQNKFTDAINTGKAILSKTSTPKAHVYRLLAYSYLGAKDTTTACEYSNLFLSKATDDDLLGQDYILNAYSCGRGNPDVIRSDVMKAVKMDSVLSRQIDLLNSAIENARANGQKLLEAYMRLMSYQMRPNADKSELISYISVPFYLGGDYQKADSVAKVYISLAPDSIHGYYWSSLALSAIDTSMQLGLAMPTWDKVLSIAETDKVRFKAQGVKAAIMLAIYTNNIKSDRPGAIAYVQRGLAFDPANANLLNLQTALQPKQQPPKTQTNQPPPKTKGK